MISDEELKGIIDSDVRHSALLVELAKELLAHRKAWSEPVAYLNDADLARWCVSGEVHEKYSGPGLIAVYRKLS